MSWDRLLVLFRAAGSADSWVRAELLLQGVDRLLHALEVFRVDLEDPVLGSRSKTAWKINWNRSFRQFQNVLGQGRTIFAPACGNVRRCRCRCRCRRRRGESTLPLFATGAGSVSVWST
jgi:hypothetical protein